MYLFLILYIRKYNTFWEKIRLQLNTFACHIHDFDRYIWGSMLIIFSVSMFAVRSRSNTIFLTKKQLNLFTLSFTVRTYSSKCIKFLLNRERTLGTEPRYLRKFVLKDLSFQYNNCLFCSWTREILIRYGKVRLESNWERNSPNIRKCLRERDKNYQNSNHSLKWKEWKFDLSIVTTCTIEVWNSKINAQKVII